MVNQGAAFTTDAHNAWGYNDRGELTSSYRYVGSDPSTTTNEVMAQRRLYDYDPMGNRELRNGVRVPLSTLLIQKPRRGEVARRDEGFRIEGTVHDITYGYDALGRLIDVASSSSLLTSDYSFVALGSVFTCARQSSWKEDRIDGMR